MGKPISNIQAVALLAGVALAGIMPAAAAPLFVPNTPTVQSDVVQVQDSAKIIRRESFHHDGRGGEKRHRDRRDGREFARDHRDHHDGHRQFRPRATPKYAYDAYGNYRTYDGNGWDDWDRRDGWDKKKRQHRPRIYKLHSFGVQEPSPALKDILTAVPD